VCAVYTVSFPVLSSGFPRGNSLCSIGLTCRKDQNPVPTVRPFRFLYSIIPLFTHTLSLPHPSLTSLCRRSPDYILRPKRHADFKRLLRPGNGSPFPWNSRRAAFRIRGPCSVDPVPGAADRYPSPTNGAVRIIRSGASAPADDLPARSRPARRP
jgi:hypothetical protein